MKIIYFGSTWSTKSIILLHLIVTESRLVRLNLLIPAKDNETTEDWAFLIEPMDLMAARLNATDIKSEKLSMRTVNREDMDLVALFQYMIGNGDFSVTGRHNLKILAVKPPGPQGFVPVPYDFDYYRPGECSLCHSQGETWGSVR